MSNCLVDLEAVQAQLEDAWTALCKQDWGAATQNVFEVRASVTKLVESARGAAKRCPRKAKLQTQAQAHAQATLRAQSAQARAR